MGKVTPFARGGQRLGECREFPGTPYITVHANGSLRMMSPEFVSGPTESQCKLCTKRLKGYGRRWDRPNATAVAALDALDRNGQWRQVWPNACPVAV